MAALENNILRETHRASGVTSRGGGDEQGFHAGIQHLSFQMGIFDCRSGSTLGKHPTSYPLPATTVS